MIQELMEKRKRWVEANRENGFETGLKHLLTELYPDNAHFIYELLQNAEDAHAQEVRFILEENRVEFEHNGERLFSFEDVDAITSIGFSTKRDDPTNIGKFGVGFKAVFAYTETPGIESGEFHFQVHDMVVPEPIGTARIKPGDKQTRFILPFNNPKKSADRARNEIETLLRKLDAATLLFLTRIRKIEYLLPDTSLGYIERIGHGDHRFEIRVQQPDELAPSSTWFLKFDKEVQVQDDEAENEGQQLKTCRIVLAFGLSPVATRAGIKEKKDVGAIPEWELVPLERGRVCIYFPADKETSNLRFHLHAPFASTVARDSVRDCPGNNALRDHLAELLAESMHAIRDQGLLTVRTLALLPNNKDNLPTLYQPLLARLVREFQVQDLVPMKRDGHASARSIFRGSAKLQVVIDDKDLAHLLNKPKGAPLWAANPPQRHQCEDNFLAGLGIEQLELEKLVLHFSSIPETMEAWLKSKSMPWHRSFYALLITTFSENASSEYQATLRNLPLVRLASGRYQVGRQSCFPVDQMDVKHKLQPVERATYSVDNQDVDQAKKFLKAIGVREYSLTDVVVDLIIPEYEEHVPRKRHFKHIATILKAVGEAPKLEKESLKKHLGDTAFILVEKPGKSSHAYAKPAELYWSSEKDTSLWRENHGVKFIDDEYNKSNQEFFQELGVQEFDIVENVITAILPSYRAPVPLKQHRHDIGKICQALDTDSQEKKAKLQDALCKSSFVLTQTESSTGPLYKKPTEVSLFDKEWFSFFQDGAPPHFLSEEYDGKMVENFKDLGVTALNPIEAAKTIIFRMAHLSLESEIDRKRHLSNMRFLAETCWPRIKKQTEKASRENWVKEYKTRAFIITESADSRPMAYRRPGDLYFHSDGLGAYFTGNEEGKFVWGEYGAAIQEFLEAFGVSHDARVEKKKEDQAHNISIEASWGHHKRGLEGYDPEIKVDGLHDALILPPSMEKSRYIWKKIALPHQQCITGYIESSSRQTFEGSEKTKAESEGFGRFLIGSRWLPNKEGEFVSPTEVTLDVLPEDFQGDQVLASQLGMKQNYIGELAKKCGISPDRLEFTKDNPEEIDRLIAEKESRKNKPEFPTQAITDSDRRREKVAEQHADAPAKEYEKRERSVRTSEPEIDRRTSLRSMYTNPDGIMVCQVCEHEMPFKKRNGEYYFETVEALSKDYFTKEHEAQFLALCPVCAAKYKEFVKSDNHAMDEFVSTLKVSETPEVPLKLGDWDTSLRFVETHFLDIKTILGVLE